MMTEQQLEDLRMERATIQKRILKLSRDQETQDIITQLLSQQFLIKKQYYKEGGLPYSQTEYLLKAQ